MRQRPRVSRSPPSPTVLIFQCTFVCDARCEMCSNWQRGDRKSDITLEEIDRVFQSPLWKNVEAIEAKDPYTKGHCGRVAIRMRPRVIAVADPHGFLTACVADHRGR